MLDVQFSLCVMPAGSPGSCVHQNKYPVQEWWINCHESLQVHLIEGIDHCTKGNTEVQDIIVHVDPRGTQHKDEVGPF